MIARKHGLRTPVKETEGPPSALFGEVLVALAQRNGAEGLEKVWEDARLSYALGVAQGAEETNLPTRPTPRGKNLLGRTGQKIQSRQPVLDPDNERRTDGREFGCHEAAIHFRKDAFHGSKVAQFMMGECFLIGDGITQNLEAARSWYVKSADQGYPPAKCKLGTMLIKGMGGDKDIGKGHVLWIEAADKGNKNAKANITGFENAIASLSLL